MTKDSAVSDDDSFPENEEAFQEFIDGPRDEYLCESCGSKAYRGHLGGEPGAFYAEVDGEPSVVCHDCDDAYDWETIETRVRDRRRGFQRTSAGLPLVPVISLFRPIYSRIPLPISVEEIPPERRSSLVAEQTIFIGRLVAFTVVMGIVLLGSAVFAAVAGALFVSPVAGFGWFEATVELIVSGLWYLAARPELVLSLVGVGYLLHLGEYQHHLDAPYSTPERSRPRWQLVGILAGVGCVGWVVWVSSQMTLLPSALLPVGVLVWSAGTFTLVFVLHYALQEDRWTYGLNIRGVLGKFPAQFALGLMLYDGVLGLPGSNTVSFGVAIVPPLVGLLYVTRRQLAFTERGARFGRLVESSKRRWRQRMPAVPGWVQPKVEASQATSQFEAVTESARTDSHETGHTSSKRDREEELKQANEWASYLESELHDREEQLQDLEARLARVRQNLDEDQQTDTESDAANRREREDLLTDLFDIRDNFRRALDAEDVLEDDAAGDFREGIELIDRQIGAMIEREGVSEIDTCGEVDPGKHRVVGTVPAPDHEAGEILEVYRLGYRDGDRVLREADVVVAEEATEHEGPDAANSGPSRDDTSSNRDRSVNHGDDPA